MTSTPRTRLAIAALAIAALGLANCGSDDDGGGSPFGEGGQEEDDGDDGSAEETPDETTDDGEAVDTTPEDDGDDDGDDGGNDMGFCHVKVTGVIESEWTTPGGGVTAAYGHWVPEAMQDPATSPENYFVINCTGEGQDYVGFIGSGEGPGVPMQPATYALPEGSIGISGGAEFPVDVLVGLNGPDTVWETGVGATLTITEFDEDHIAGTFTIPVVDGLADMTGVDNGTATITGEFDLANPQG